MQAKDELPEYVWTAIQKLATRLDCATDLVVKLNGPDGEAHRCTLGTYGDIVTEYRSITMQNGVTDGSTPQSPLTSDTASTLSATSSLSSRQQQLQLQRGLNRVMTSANNNNTNNNINNEGVDTEWANEYLNSRDGITRPIFQLSHFGSSSRQGLPRFRDRFIAQVAYCGANLIVDVIYDHTVPRAYPEIVIHPHPYIERMNIGMDLIVEKSRQVEEMLGIQRRHFELELDWPARIFTREKIIY
ncbi:hypothetical protein GQ42DRAFT_159063 [Ramicandelaber brevisporus]|nr:hypothetical protein GQ42DRAFT_159063 [Ramicandelaber brevisporus]